MEVSPSHARELEKQAARKAELRDCLVRDLDGVSSVLLEAGCGHGHWLTSYSQNHPNAVCVGVDLISWRIRKAEAKRDKRGLGNLHFYKAELGEFLEVLPASLTLNEVVLLFPDPWPKARHHRRRMVQAEFLSQIAQRMASKSRFYFRSDDRAYYEWTVEHLEAHGDWSIEDNAGWLHESDTYFQVMMKEYFSLVASRN